MDLILFLAADFAKIDASGKLDILGIFNNINAQQFPYFHPTMYLVFGFKPELGEYGDTRELKINLVYENGEQFFEIPQKIEVPPVSGGQRRDVNGVMSLHNIPFPKQGTYEFRIFLERDQKGALPIEAKLREQKRD
jgi:hypothetical protein